MQQIHIISVGKLTTELNIIAEQYKKMIKSALKVTEITYNQKLPENQIKQFEAKKICEYLNNKSYKIILDVTGRSLSSHEFTTLISINKDIDFVIGGAYGFDQTILDLADFKLSFSKMTFPHQLAKILLLEQIYRAQTITENHPYHK